MKIAVDIASVFEAAQAYVMLSRIEGLEQLYILESLPENKIYASRKALGELEEMNERSLNRNPVPWDEMNEESMKVATLNCMNLKNTHKDIIKDQTLLKSDILMLQETWLTDQDSDEFEIPGYEKHFNNAGSGKGIAVYYRKEMFRHVSDIRQEQMQLTKFQTTELDIITVYRSERGNSVEFLNNIKSLITEERPTVICGDLNICYNATRHNRITKHLENNNFKQVVKYPTHIRGRLIDHFYHNIGNDIIVNQYTPYPADRRIIDNGLFGHLSVRTLF